MPSLNKIIGLFAGYGGVFCILNYFIYLWTIPLIMFIMFLIGTLLRGSEQSVLYILFGFINRPDIHISGTVAEGFEKVQEEFRKNFQSGMESGAQCVVYHKGKKVVDLYGIHNIYGYDQNSLQNVYSSTKTIEGIIVAMLVDRGLLKYEETVKTYWPEFQQHGKQNIKIEDVLRHEGGMEYFKPPVTKEMAQKLNIKYNMVGKFIEQVEPKWGERSKRAYHSVTRGLILNEVVRRVDPNRRTIGEFLQDEICKPLDIQFYIGVPQHKLIKVKDIISTQEERTFWFYMQGFLPSFLGRKLTFGFPIIHFLRKFIHDLTKVKNGDLNVNSINWRTAEFPSANGTCNAKAMAKIASVMAQKGNLDGHQFMSEKTWELAHSEPVVAYDNILLKKTKMNKGGQGVFDKEIGYETEDQGFVGWKGIGGSFLQWHAEKEIGFAYAMNLKDGDISSQRALRLKLATYQCVQQLENKDKKDN